MLRIIVPENQMPDFPNQLPIKSIIFIILMNFVAEKEMIGFDYGVLAIVMMKFN